MLSLSCTRQEILMDCSCSNSAKIPVTTDWTQSGITPQNITMLFYSDIDGSLAFEHRYEHNSNEVHSYVHVPVGKYTVVVFNELRGQISNIAVRGYENLSTLGFYAMENPDVRARSRDNSYIHEPGNLGVKIIRDFEVTNELIAYTHEDELTNVSVSTKSTSEALLNILPENKINWLDIKAHIKGLNNARMPALVDLQNISDGYIVQEDKNTMTPATMQFDMNNRTYDTGSYRDGTISTRVALFGTLGDRVSVSDHSADFPIIVDILFMLVDKDKTLVSRKVDVTNLITFDKELSGSVTLTINIDIDDPLPDVKPEGGTDSGFGSELEDWDEIDVPLS